ncbi:MAG: stage II sporulation protein M [Eubacteriaceae bacterium]|jgi:stage II sporulation protein M
MLKKYYNECGDYLNGPVFKAIAIVSGAFLTLAVIFTAYYWVHPDEADAIVQIFSQSAQSIYENGEINAWRLILNNIEAAGTSVLYGFIPFLFLPVISIVVNAVVIGAVIAAASRASGLAGVVIMGILPHGIFELSALFICMGMGVYLCLVLSKKCLRRQTASFKSVILGSCKVFVLIVIPLLITAGLIETYVTPYLVSLV